MELVDGEKGNQERKACQKESDRKEASLFTGVQVFKKLNTELPHQPTSPLQSIRLR